MAHSRQRGSGVARTAPEHVLDVAIGQLRSSTVFVDAVQVRWGGYAVILQQRCKSDESEQLSCADDRRAEPAVVETNLPFRASFHSNSSPDFARYVRVAGC